MFQSHLLPWKTVQEAQRPDPHHASALVDHPPPAFVRVAPYTVQFCFIAGCNHQRTCCRLLYTRRPVKARRLRRPRRPRHCTRWVLPCKFGLDQSHHWKVFALAPDVPVRASSSLLDDQAQYALIKALPHFELALSSPSSQSCSELPLCTPLFTGVQLERSRRPLLKIAFAQFPEGYFSTQQGTPSRASRRQ